MDVFPLPAPKPSAQAPIPRALLQHAGGDASMRLGDVSARLSDALDAAGYEHSLRPTQGGFAMLTRIERINSDGSPVAQGRFSVTMTTADQRPFTLGGYLRALFTANPGYYRVIAIVVSNHLVTSGNATPVASTLNGWVRSGAQRLPGSIAALPYGADYTTTAFIYEFSVSGADSTVKQLDPSPLLGREHLEKAGVWPALKR
jgi:hypothetical protein